MSDKLAAERAARQDALEADLDELLRRELRAGWMGNTLAWLAVVVGGFVATVALLWLVIGR